MLNVWYAAAFCALAFVNVNAHKDVSATTKGSIRSLKHPTIIGHRGAPAYLPDHTIEGYKLAIRVGTDVIEPDLVMTKDGVLIVRHEPYLDGTTDVADHPEFADRATTKMLDGMFMSGFFASDFTLQEIKTLRAVQPLPQRDQSYNGLFEIPTFEEVIQLAQTKAIKYNRTIAIYPEIKHSSFHKALGLPIEKTMLKLLTQYGWNHADAPVFIQSFETENLRELCAMTNITLVQLVSGYSSDPITGDVTYLPIFDRPYDWVLTNRTENFGYLTTPVGLAEVATYADIISPWKRYLLKAVAVEVDASGIIVDSNGDGRITDADYDIIEYPDLIEDAHAVGLDVHTWTMRDEDHYLAASYSGDATLEYLQLLDMGVDGIISDNCKTAVPTRDAWLAKQ